MLEKINERGFKEYIFVDKYYNSKHEWKEWKIQKCSHATSDCFWIKIGDEIIHISEEQKRQISEIFNPISLRDLGEDNQ